MKLSHKLLISAKNILQPLPDPKELTEKFTLLLKTSCGATGSKAISDDKVAWIVESILEEAKTSRGFGLFIRPEDLENEITVWLVFVNNYFDSKNKLLGKTFEQISKDVTELLNDELNEASKYYFEKIKHSKPKIVNANTAFRVHMEAVRCRILTQIFSHHPPFQETKEE